MKKMFLNIKNQFKGRRLQKEVFFLFAIRKKLLDKLKDRSEISLLLIIYI